MINNDELTGDNPTEEVLLLIKETQRALQILRNGGSEIPLEVDLLLGIIQGQFHNLVDAIVQRYERELVQQERVMMEHYNDQS